MFKLIMLSKISLFTLLLVIFVLLSCSQNVNNDSDPLITTGETDITPTPTVGPDSLFAPVKVNVQLIEGVMVVSWDTVTDAEGYRVFRKSGNSDFISIAGDCYKDTIYYDSGFSPKEENQYAVRSVYGSIVSRTITYSEIVSQYILGLEATRLLSNRTITVKWNEKLDIDSYKIYRSTSKDGLSNPVLFENVLSSPFEDDIINNPDPLTKISSDTPYYYWVTWIDSVGEQGAGGDYVLGFIGDNRDFGEPDNDDWYNLSDITVLTTECDLSKPPIIYTINQGDGSSFVDEDYYKYYGLPNDFFIYIKLLKDTESEFLKLDSNSDLLNKLYFQIVTPFAPELEWESETIISTYSVKEFLFSSLPGDINDYLDTDGNISVYFRIFPAPGTKDIFEQYMVTIEKFERRMLNE